MREGGEATVWYGLLGSIIICGFLWVTCRGKTEGGAAK